MAINPHDSASEHPGRRAGRGALAGPTVHTIPGSPLGPIVTVSDTSEPSSPNFPCTGTPAITLLTHAATSSASLLTTVIFR